MKVWIITTVNPKTGKVGESTVIDKTDEDKETFLKSQQERFGEAFRGAKLQICVESS